MRTFNNKGFQLSRGSSITSRQTYGFTQIGVEFTNLHASDERGQWIWTVTRELKGSAPASPPSIIVDLPPTYRGTITKCSDSTPYLYVFSRRTWIPVQKTLRCIKIHQFLTRLRPCELPENYFREGLARIAMVLGNAVFEYKTIL